MPGEQTRTIARGGTSDGDAAGWHSNGKGDCGGGGVRDGRGVPVNVSNV